MTQLFNKANISLEKEPFPHFGIPEFLDPAYAVELLDWFEDTNDWKRHTEDDFYDTFDLNFYRAKVSENLEIFRSADCLSYLLNLMEKNFDTTLETRVDIMGHRLVKGQKIKIHSDFGPIRQTHRLVIQVNRNWEASFGGILMLFDNEVPDETSAKNKFYLPNSSSAVGFEISPYSFHAVSTINQGDRFTLVYSFYDKQGYNKFNLKEYLV